MSCSTAYYEIEKFDGGPWSVMQSRTCALAPKIPLVPTLQRYTDMRIKVGGPPSPSSAREKFPPRRWKIGNTDGAHVVSNASPLRQTNAILRKA